MPENRETGWFELSWLTFGLQDLLRIKDSVRLRKKPKNQDLLNSLESIDLSAHLIV
jgi:hypothetical protein